MNTEQKFATEDTQRWIGLANVRPVVGNDLLAGARGAFVAVIGDAINESTFLALVERGADELDFEVVSLEDVELVSCRTKEHPLPDDLVAALSDLSPSSPIAFGSFHSYRELD